MKSLRKFERRKKQLKQDFKEWENKKCNPD